MNNGTYPVNVAETLRRHMKKATPNRTDDDIEDTVKHTQKDFKEHLDSYRVRDGGVDILNGAGEIVVSYKIEKIKFNEKTEAVLVLDPDEPWKNQSVSLMVTKEDDKIIWKQTLGEFDQIIILQKPVKSTNEWP